MTKPYSFAPERIAYFEAAGWRAYYDRKWLKLLYLIVMLCQEQFRIPFPVSLLAAYYTTRASIAWVPIDHDLARVRLYLEKFYRLVHRYAHLPFDPVKVSEQELRYFAVHRRLVDTDDKQELVETLVALHSAIFSLTLEQVRESAELRVQAAATVDRITHGQSLDVEADWMKLQEYLRQCYASIQRQLSI